VLLGVLFGAFNQYSVARIAEEQDVSIPSAAVAGLPSTILQSFALFFAAFIARAIQQRMDPAGIRRGIYLLGIVITDVIFSSIRLVLVPRDLPDAGIIAFRDLVALLIVTALFGIAGERLARQVRQTQDALPIIATQREQLLVADESARQEVARFLHDTVQADLVVLAMQLRSQAATLTSTEGERIASVVDELDKEIGRAS
jgi:signal transduction histidine kinase